MCRNRNPSPWLGILPLVAVLLLAPAAPAQLDPVACKSAKKELAIVCKSAAFEQRVQLADAVVNFAFALAYPLMDAQVGNFNTESLESMRANFDGMMRDLQDSTVYAANMVGGAIPQLLSQAFGGLPPALRLPDGFRPGDGGLLDDFRAKLAKQQAKVTTALARLQPKVAKMLRKYADVELAWVLVPPEIAWVAGDAVSSTARTPRLEPLDVLLAARGGPVGTRLLLGGWADESAGELRVEIVGPSGGLAASQNILPQEDRWSATFADVNVNPVIVRVSRGDTLLAERVIGIP